MTTLEFKGGDWFANGTKVSGYNATVIVADHQAAFYILQIDDARFTWEPTRDLQKRMAANLVVGQNIILGNSCFYASEQQAVMSPDWNSIQFAGA